MRVYGQAKTTVGWLVLVIAQVGIARIIPRQHLYVNPEALDVSCGQDSCEGRVRLSSKTRNLDI